MKKSASKRFLFLVISIVIAAVIGFLPAESESMSRAAWQYTGLFIAMLCVIISGALEDWAAGLVVCALLVIFKIDSFANVFTQFSGTSVWMLIAIYAMCTGLNNSGFLKRLALNLLRIFPRSYKGQAIGFTIISAILCPLLPSTTAKVGIMTPLACEVGDQAGLPKHSKAVIGLWGICIVAGFYLSCAFISGSAQCAIMAGMMGDGALTTWGDWFMACWPYYVVGLLVMLAFCLFFCAPKKGEMRDLPADFYKKKIEELGPMSLKEKQGAVILVIALAFWLTESLHGIPAITVALIADAAFLFCGLLTKVEFSAKGNWNMVVFVATLMGFSGYMSSTGVGNAIAKILSPIAPLISNPWIFIPCLCIIVVLIRFIVVSQLCTCAIMLTVFGSLGVQYGLSTFVIIFITHQIGGNWNTSYNNPVAQGLIAIVGDNNITYRDSRIVSYVYCLACLIAFTLSIPVWQGMQLI